MQDTIEIKTPKAAFDIKRIIVNGREIDMKQLYKFTFQATSKDLIIYTTEYLPIDPDKNTK